MARRRFGSRFRGPRSERRAVCAVGNAADDHVADLDAGRRRWTRAPDSRHWHTKCSDVGRMLDVRFMKAAKTILFVLEAAIVVILAGLAVLTIMGLLMELPAVVRPPFLGSEQLGQVVDHVLAVFILIELLVTAVAYIRGHDVVRRIFEAMLVALARKLISLDIAAASFEKVGSLSLLLVAVGGAWMLVRSRRDLKKSAKSV